MTLIKFIFIGLLVTFSGEYQINILIQHESLGKYLPVFIIYTILISIFYYFGKFLDKKFLSAKADLIYYFISGFVGLIFEWLFVGNSLFANPDANQAGMFCWWTAVFMIPRIFSKVSDLNIETTKKKIYFVLIPYSIISLIAVSLLPTDPIIIRIMVAAIFMIIGFITVNYYLVYYLISQNPHLQRKLTYFYRTLIILAIINFFW